MKIIGFLASAALAASLCAAPAFARNALWSSLKVGQSTIDYVQSRIRQSENYACRVGSEATYPAEEKQIIVSGPCLRDEFLEHILFNFNSQGTLTAVKAHYVLNEASTDDFAERLMKELGGNFKRFGALTKGDSFVSFQKTENGVDYTLRVANESLDLDVFVKDLKEAKTQISDSTKAVASHLFNWELHILNQNLFALAYTPEEILFVARNDPQGWKEISENGCTMKGIVREKTPNYLKVDGVNVFLSNMRRVSGIPLDKPVILQLKHLNVDRGTIYAEFIPPAQLTQPTLGERMEALDLLAQGKVKEAERSDPQVKIHYARAKSLEGTLSGGPCFVPFNGGQPFNEKKCLEVIQNFFASPSFTREASYQYFLNAADKF